MDNRDIFLIIVFGLIAVVGVPQMWKEENSWWFAIIKFYFGIIPFMLVAMGIFSFFAGPICAIMGIVYAEYRLVTALYIYFGIMVVLTDYINKRKPNFLNTL